MTPASITDTWNAVASDSLAHLFPDGKGPCLCGRHAEPGQRACAILKGYSDTAGRVGRRYCPDCLKTQHSRWLMHNQPR